MGKSPHSVAPSGTFRSIYIADAERGDRILVCEGVAIARVEAFRTTRRHNYVSSHTW